MRVSGTALNPSLKSQLVATLSLLISDIKDRKEAQTFLSDFFNEAELTTYTKRLAVAYWLKKGRSYSNIKQNLKVSSATIAAIEKLLKKPGITLAITKIEAEEWANVWTERIKKIIK